MAQAPPPMDLHRYIKAIPDFPAPGILFRDVTPLLRDPAATAAAVRAMADPFRQAGVRVVAGVGSRPAPTS